MVYKLTIILCQALHCMYLQFFPRKVWDLSEEMDVNSIAFGSRMITTVSCAAWDTYEFITTSYQPKTNAS